MTKSNQIYARLVSGCSYTYDGKTYIGGVWEPVTAIIRAHLEENAVDGVTISGGGGPAHSEDRQKFEFQVGEPNEVAAASNKKPPRTRSR